MSFSVFVTYDEEYLCTSMLYDFSVNSLSEASWKLICVCYVIGNTGNPDETAYICRVIWIYAGHRCPVWYSCSSASLASTRKQTHAGVSIHLYYSYLLSTSLSETSLCTCTSSQSVDFHPLKMPVIINIQKMPVNILQPCLLIHNR